MEGLKLLELRDLCVWYAPGKPVLSEFSLDLGTNEIVGLIGLNGAGKTTLIKTLSGLVEGFRLKQALCYGKTFTFRDYNFKRRRYTVFAEDHSFQYFTFNEYLSYAASSYGAEIHELPELLHEFQFEEYVNVLFKELSTGNIKKAFLITAFALRPELLLLDEPINGLDFQSTEALYKRINDYRKYGTVLFSSHILESLCLTSDRVIVLEKGRFKRSFSGSENKAEKIREALSGNGSV